jgi:hypothetical protein
LAGDFLAGDFLAGDFLAAIFLGAAAFFGEATFLGAAAAFLAGEATFLATDFLAGAAAFFTAAFFTAAFLGEATFFTAGSVLAATAFLGAAAFLTAAFLGEAAFLATTAFFFKGDEAALEFLTTAAFLTEEVLDLADLTEEAADLTEEADFFDAVEASEKTLRLEVVERAGEAEAVDSGAASFLGAAAFLATDLGGDFLAGEAMVGLVDLLGVFGVCPALLFLATVPNFPPLFLSLFGSVAREAFSALDGVARIVLGVLLAPFEGVVPFLKGDLDNVNGEF